MLDLDVLRNEFVGKTYNDWTILDVVRQDSKLYFKCKCICGTIKLVLKKTVLNNNSKNCGCYKKSATFAEKCSKNTKNYYNNNLKENDNFINKLKDKFIGETYHWLTITDIIRNDKNYIMFVCKCKCGKVVNVYKDNLLRDKTWSCGCYSKSEEKINKHKQWYENNPDKVKELALQHSQWHKDHKDEFNKSIQQREQNYINNPDKRYEISQNISLWYKNNKDKVKEKGLQHSQWCKNNPDKLAERNAKCHEWYENNPDKVDEIIEKNKKWRNENKETVLNINKKIAKAHQSARQNADFTILKPYISDDTFDELCSGKITVKDNINIMCPECNSFHSCKLNNIFRIRSSTLRNGYIPVCGDCFKKLTTSKYEDEIEDYIKSFYDGEIIRNTRDVISPLELDIYIPEKKVAIEFNGDYFHSEKFRNNDYHINKFKLCKEKGIILVSIFESEWNKNKETIKEYLKDLFDGKENKLSFNENKTLMNNNYPSVLKYNFDPHIIENYWIYKEYKVYNCGYSKII